MKKAKIHMADGGDIVIELFEKEAPGTVQKRQTEPVPPGAIWVRTHSPAVFEAAPRLR